MNSKVREKWQHDVQCAKCNDIIWSRYDGEFRSCKCGAIAVDQTPYYARYIGDQQDIIIKKDGQDRTNNSTTGD